MDFKKFSRDFLVFFLYDILPFLLFGLILTYKRVENYDILISAVGWLWMGHVWIVDELRMQNEDLNAYADTLSERVFDLEKEVYSCEEK